MDDDACAAGDERAHRDTGTMLPLRAIPARRRIHVAFALSLALTWLVIPSTQAKAECRKSVAEAVSVQGSVEVRRAGRLGWQSLMRGQALCAGDVARAASNSRADILLGGHTHMRLDQQTRVRFPRPTLRKRTWLDVVQGWLHFISRTPQRLEVDTPYVNAAIEGTEFAVRIEDDRTLLWVYEGRVVASNAQGALTLTNGEAAVAERGQAPRPQVDLNPRDAVDWALYYPPLLDLRTLDAGPSRVALAQTIALYQKGDVPAALSTLDNVPNAERDARYFNIKTALLLSVGRVKEAQASIAAASQRDPQSAAPLAYESIIALTQNRKEQSRDLAEQAVALESKSPIAHAARSYALQAAFDLEGALTSARQTVELAPNDALAWARLAELELSRGYSDAAISAAEQAKALDPAVARTQSVLGFVNLARIDTDQASQAFNAAIDRDQADPLPRLGLGLSKIREGDLEGGRRDIEIAASLDPSQSIVRSYLGKAYFDEKRDPLAAEQYAMAKELDPKDPTPWFYDAILEQTENRPVEALHDIQRSIKLNNNRAVYRSRLLLDQDLAARSASQARIYRDLGFEQLALVEGWKSVNTDPSSYGAHRLLADSYSVLPGHEIARASELLQSQLLQPLNVTPLQPQLAETNLAIIEGGGPSTTAVNEFNPLFTRNQTLFQLDAIGGSNSTYGDDLVASGLYGPMAVSFGQFLYHTDGFRPDGNIDHDIYNAFVQYSPSPVTSIQAEVRTRHSVIGDVEQRVFGFPIAIPKHRSFDTDSARLGLRQELSPGVNIIGSFIYNNHDETVRTIPDVGLDSEFHTHNYSFEPQLLWHKEDSTLIIGGGYFDDTGTFRQEDIPSDINTDYRNAYLYWLLEPFQSVQVTAGASYDSLNDASISRHQFNPKLGIIWTPTDRATLRLAAVRVLRRPLLKAQTIEPTQVAGFNQFFDDRTGSRSTRYGAALDYKFSDYVYAGVEFTRRDISSPILDSNFDIDEQFHRIYGYWTPSTSLALSAEYRYDDFKTDETAFGVTGVRTQSVPFGVAAFHPSGVFTRLDGTYVDQHARAAEQSAENQFWVFDLALGYRLPQRRGLISVQIQNLFDKSFLFQDRNFLANEPLPVEFQPSRSASLRLTLSF